MKPALTLVLATHNAGKLAELQALCGPLGVRLQSQAELGIPEAAEPHRTFVENALAKARHASAASGLPALADDAGLCVEAFGGQPLSLGIITFGCLLQCFERGLTTF